MPLNKKQQLNHTHTGQKEKKKERKKERGARDVIDIVEGNEYSNPSSNLGRGCLHFTLR